MPADMGFCRGSIRMPTARLSHSSAREKRSSTTQSETRHSAASKYLSVHRNLENIHEQHCPGVNCLDIVCPLLLLLLSTPQFELAPSKLQARHSAFPYSLATTSALPQRSHIKEICCSKIFTSIRSFALFRLFPVFGVSR